MYAKPYDATISAKKGATEGGIAAGVAALIGAVVMAVRANNPGLPGDANTDAAVAGLATGAIVGGLKWLRNRLKHKPKKP